jgi:hypothetical protein
MEAIFNFSLIRTVRTSGSARSSLVVLPDLENMGLTVGSLLQSCIEAVTYVISHPLPLMAAILHSAVTPTSENVYTKLIVLPDPEKARV